MNDKYGVEFEKLEIHVIYILYRLAISASHSVCSFLKLSSVKIAEAFSYSGKNVNNCGRSGSYLGHSTWARGLEEPFGSSVLMNRMK